MRNRISKGLQQANDPERHSVTRKDAIQNVIYHFHLVICVVTLDRKMFV